MLKPFASRYGLRFAQLVLMSNPDAYVVPVAAVVAAVDELEDVAAAISPPVRIEAMSANCDECNKYCIEKVCL